MDQLNMLSLAFEIRTDVAAKWSVNGVRGIVSKLFFLRKRIILKHPAGRPTTDHCA